MPVKNPIGVMQGRLLPKYMGRYQAHPVGCWQDEFGIASGLNLELIEFILDFEDAWLNPLMTEAGCKQIRQTSEAAGVRVVSICADYFMDAPLHDRNPDTVVESQNVLRRLIENAPILEVADIVIPCVDQSSLNDDDDFQRLIEGLSPIIENADRANVNFSLETDLEPTRFARLLDEFGSSRVTVNYDIGNSASLGYSVAEEFDAYGPRISDVHIKDRTLGGGSVVLGTGAADIGRTLELLYEHNFAGPFILQAYRDDEGLAIFKSQFAWFTNLANDVH